MWRHSRYPSIAGSDMKAIYMSCSFADAKGKKKFVGNASLNSQHFRYSESQDSPKSQTCPWVILHSAGSRLFKTRKMLINSSLWKQVTTHGSLCLCASNGVVSGVSGFRVLVAKFKPWILKEHGDPTARTPDWIFARSTNEIHNIT